MLSYKETVAKIIQKFNLDLTLKGNKFVGSCPVHGGDNKHAFNLYPISGIWICRSHNCHETHGKNLYSLIRQLAIKENIKLNSNLDVENFIAKDLDSIKVHHFEIKKEEKIDLKIKLKDFLKNRILPCPFFSKKFGEQIVAKHNIVYAMRPKDDMIKRTVVPVFDEKKEFVVAYQGRIIYEECKKCGSYHSSMAECGKYFTPKWKMGVGCNTSKAVFNSWFWDKPKTIFLTESVGNVLKLEMFGVKNAGATFGTQFSQHQLDICLKSGANRIVYLKDAGKPGELCSERISLICKGKIELIIPNIDLADDIAAVDNNNFKEVVLKHIERYI